METRFSVTYNMTDTNAFPLLIFYREVISKHRPSSFLLSTVHYPNANLKLDACNNIGKWLDKYDNLNMKVVKECVALHAIFKVVILLHHVTELWVRFMTVLVIQ